jgi:hypothetical protein
MSVHSLFKAITDSKRQLLFSAAPGVEKKLKRRGRPASGLIFSVESDRNTKGGECFPFLFVSQVKHD